MSAAELIQRQQAILLRNAENQKKRADRDNIAAQVEHQQSVVADLRERLARATSMLEGLTTALEDAISDVEGLHDESTAELEADIANVDDINRKVRANLDKTAADDEARTLQQRYDDLTTKIEAIRKQKNDLLTDAALPLPGLNVQDGVLLYKGKAWDCMSGAEQLIVGASIASAIKPQCGFILLDKLEQLDRETLEEFGMWLGENHLQAIATRVSTGEECTIIIEDGQAEEPIKSEAAPTWTPGQF